MAEAQYLVQQEATFDALICAVLRGEAASWPWGDPGVTGPFLSRVGVHGVGALLHAAPLPTNWPQPVRHALRQCALQQAAWEASHRYVLAGTLEALASRGIRPVLLKGTALAYSLYPTPFLRTRADTDLLIAAKHRDAIPGILAPLGFDRDNGVAGEYVSYQTSFGTSTDDGNAHVLDIHWKINNSQVLADLLRDDEVAAAAVPLTDLCANALSLHPVQALLLAAFHRASHIQNPYYVDGVAHYGGDRLIWLFDIHLLARAFSLPHWSSLCRLANERGLGPICLQALRDARERLATPVPPSVLEELATMSRLTAPVRYLSAGKLKQQWMDFVALRRPGARRRYVIEMLFPGRNYMRTKYTASASAWLPWLYFRRAVGGILKLTGLARARPTDSAHDHT